MTVGQQNIEQKPGEANLYIVQEKPATTVVMTTTPAVAARDDVTRRTSRARMRKYVCAGMTCVLVVAMLVVCTLVAIKLVADWKLHQTKIEHSFKAPGKSGSSEETIVNETFYKDDSGNWMLTYHITAGGHIDSHVLDDRTRGVRIVKRKTSADSFQCYIVQYTPTVNSTFDPQQSMTSQDVVEVTKVLNSSSRLYAVSERPINDILVLTSREHREFCGSADIYMLYPTDTKPAAAAAAKPEPQMIERRKRWLWCDYRWTSIVCGYFQFTDHPQVTYFGCNFPCYEI